MHGAALLIPLAFAGAAAASAPGPQAGKWTHVTQLVSADIPGVPETLIRAADTRAPRTSCLTAKQAADTPQILLHAPGATCSSRSYTLAAGKIRGQSLCRIKDLPTPVKTVTTGTYNAKGYTTRSVTTGTRNGRPLKVVTASSGKWLGAACR
ncbi:MULTISPECIES: DUF3617 domain-containing protein [unclassified Sphingopyxis]|uniref:DUF3617 domain-containing protein n=1 Tax=unclassified Sphingopyxis TaxID=2614943 RepID=UPI000736722D|nr:MULTISPECIES: DUF3617 domain-containing protein [unclassified Sphingopyxis]KTE38755.1 hypothetical protein ATE62_10190 [Sphingopyxis sp. HIX]KTE76614.1 hypothetical protein ATE72_20395 [Sphingopyxis sp. HXXIV]